MENYLNNGYWLYWNWAEATVELNGRLGYGGRRLPGTIQTRLQNRITRPPAGMQNRLKCPPAQRAPPALLGSHQAVGGAGLTAQRIWQDLREEYGFGHGYPSVKRLVRRIKGEHPEVADVTEHPPGQET